MELPLETRMGWRVSLPQGVLRRQIPGQPKGLCPAMQHYFLAWQKCICVFQLDQSRVCGTNVLEIKTSCKMENCTEEQLFLKGTAPTAALKSDI